MRKGIYGMLLGQRQRAHIMINFYGKKRRSGYFEGWYFKQQSNRETVALIPAFHVSEDGEPSSSLQVITNARSFNIKFPARAFVADGSKPFIRLNKCFFSPTGCKIDVRSSDCDISGSLRFGPFTTPRYNIMGPFSVIPFMECHHSVVSLSHSVDGALIINGRRFAFNNGQGYIEGDSGSSFPKRYVWTHCGWDGNSIMLSVADIPFGRFSFIGCTGFIFINGKEHRIATYLGAKLLHISDDTILLRQGSLLLKIKMLKANSFLLNAPHRGSMTRRIHESVSCPVQYTCSIGGRMLLSFTSEQASFENNWRNIDESIK